MTSSKSIIRNKLIAASQYRDLSRSQRLLRFPIKSLTPLVMRKFSLQREVDIDLVWGGTFSGLLPEAVTSFIWRFGYFDLGVSLTLLEFLEEGDTFIDVGAHFGYFSVFASKLVGANGQVLSVEAMPSTYEMLQNNMSRNAPHQNYTLHKGAAFNKKCELEFNDYGIIASSLNSTFGYRGDNRSLIESNSKKISVAANTLDTISQEAGVKSARVIKIDAESSEQFVLAGMNSLLSKARPIVITEVGDLPDHDNSLSSNEIIQIMAKHDYTPHEWNSDHELSEFTPSEKISYGNLVFIPND